MQNLSIRFIRPHDDDAINIISDWYFGEWKIPPEETRERIKRLRLEKNEFHMVLNIDEVPVATGGIYSNVRLLESEHRFSSYKNWLDLVYTIPQYRRMGFGALVCEQLERFSRKQGITVIHALTSTSEGLLKRMEWSTSERIYRQRKDFVILKKNL